MGSRGSRRCTQSLPSGTCRSCSARTARSMGGVDVTLGEFIASLGVAAVRSCRRADRQEVVCRSPSHRCVSCREHPRRSLGDRRPASDRGGWLQLGLGLHRCLDVVRSAVDRAHHLGRFDHDLNAYLDRRRPRPRSILPRKWGLRSAALVCIADGSDLVKPAAGPGGADVIIDDSFTSGRESWDMRLDADGNWRALRRAGRWTDGGGRRYVRQADRRPTSPRRVRDRRPHAEHRGRCTGQWRRTGQRRTRRRVLVATVSDDRSTRPASLIDSMARGRTELPADRATAHPRQPCHAHVRRWLRE